MQKRTDNTQVKFSDKARAKLRASFADYIKNNQIDRDKLVKAVNGSELVRDGQGNKIKLTIDNLDKALADIDSGDITNYQINDIDEVEALLKPFPKDRVNPLLSKSQKLIYAALLFEFEANLTNPINQHPAMKDQMKRYDEFLTWGALHNPADDFKKLNDEIAILAFQAKESFFLELLNTDAKIQALELNKTASKELETFFNTPSLARDLVIGIGVGLLVAGAIAGFLVLTVGTAGIGPLVLGTTAAATLGIAAATGLSLGAIALGVAGVVTAVFAGVGALLRLETPDNFDKQALNKDLLPEQPKNQFSDLLNDHKDRKPTKPEDPFTKNPTSYSNPLSTPPREISSSDKALNELKQVVDKKQVVDNSDNSTDSDHELAILALLRMEQIKRGEKDVAIGLDNIQEIANKLPETYSAKQILNNYVEAIESELPLAKSPTL